MKIIRCLLVFTMIPFAVLAQNSDTVSIRLKGIIIDRETKTPLAYTSIGIQNNPAGTVSDSLGHFELALGKEYLNDTLRISMIGYDAVQLPVSQFGKSNSPIAISMTKKVIPLKEVTVTDRFQNTEIVGRQSGSTLLQASLLPQGNKEPIIGAESGLKLSAKHYPALLSSINFYLSGNNFRHIRFRVNVYSLKNNLPDTLCTHNEILVSLGNFKTGWTKVDLSPYNIIIDHDCAITLQWVDYNRDMTAKPQVLIPAGISLSHINYYRFASQDKWRSVKGNISVFTELKY